MTDKSKNNKDDFNFPGDGLSVGEKRSGAKRFNSYREKYHIDNISDLELLSELVFRECMQTRTKKHIGKLADSKTTATKEPNIPRSLISALDENLNKIIELKKELGLLREDKGEDTFKYIQQLKKKFKKWRENNQASRSLKCPHCSRLILLKIRTEAWEAQNHPYFKDQVLYSEHLVKLYKEKKITKEDVSKILGCGVFYIDWLVSKWSFGKSENPSD